MNHEVCKRPSVERDEPGQQGASWPRQKPALPLTPGDSGWEANLSCTYYVPGLRAPSSGKDSPKRQRHSGQGGPLLEGCLSRVQSQAAA